MSEDEPVNSAPFNLDRLRELVEMMEKYGLSEVSLQRGDEKWRLRRGAPGVPAAAVSYAPAPTAAAPAAATTAAQQAAELAESGLLIIKSPTVGTFYSAPSPDDPPFVTIGSRVLPDTTVCIVEAMKVFNQIPAEVSGTIVEVLINSGDSVEFGQPLFRVRPG
jgi:acetyl-CoA carboxylase biotin carboxyl carrier protein